MNVRNVHERVLPASTATVGELVNSLSSPDDGLWPRGRWPRMELDAPLGVGARGGHAFVRYHVAEYEPGRRVVFEFDPRSRVDGHHRFEVDPVDTEHTVLRHVCEARTKGTVTWAWLLVIRPLHDALVEDALDRAEYSVTGDVARPASWSPWVRLLRSAMVRSARDRVAA
jgi:hypothetical protein